MSRGRQSKVVEEIELLKALNFVSVAQTEIGSPGAMHSRFVDGYLIAYDGTLSAGYPVSDSIPECPHTLYLKEALGHVRGSYSITMANMALTVTSGKYRGVVPCIAPNAMPWPVINPPRWQLGEDWKLAALEAGTLCTDGAALVRDACIYTNGFKLFGTNGMGFIERTHSFEMPVGMLIPMVFVKAIAKVKEKIVAFGYSETTLTIYFENRSFIQTQLYAEKYAAIEKLLHYFDECILTDVSDEFFDAIAAVSKFSANGLIYSTGNRIQSHEHPDVGAQYECDGFPDVFKVNHAVLTKLKPFIKKADFSSHKNVVVFAGEQARGLIAKA